MGVPVLFTDASTPDLILKPFPGLFPSDELYPGDEVYPDDGPTLDFYAATPAFTATGVTIAVDPVEVTFDATAPATNLADVVVAVDAATVSFVATPPVVAGQDLVIPVTAGVVTFDATVPVSQGGLLVILVPSVRERPQLRLTIEVETPGGRHYRWAPDENNTQNVPANLSFSDTIPGGFENQDCTLPRKPEIDYVDLERLSTITVRGASGDIAWQGRLERTPRTSGDEVSVSPSAVGWQAHLEDDKSAQMVYVDRDLTAWRSVSSQRRQTLLSASPQYALFDGAVDSDLSSGVPVLRTALTAPWVNRAASLVLYDAGPGGISIIGYRWGRDATISGTGSWNWSLRGADNDAISSGVVSSANLASTLSTAAGSLSFLSAKRFAELGLSFEAANNANEGVEYGLRWLAVVVLGAHSAPYVTDPETGVAGVKATDVVAHAVQRWAPELNVSTGLFGSVRASSFVIPQLAFREPTTAGEIIRQTARFGLQDWAVWDDRTFWFTDRGTTSRFWRARASQAQLQETGPQLDRLWESVVVQYTDVDGSTRTVGPPGSGADTETSVLKDPDPDNPANQAGIVRRALLTMGTATPASATEVGRRFLEEQKLLDRSGQATITGLVEDDRGVVHPYWKIRAGDYISFLDAADTGYRRIVRTQKDAAARTCSVDLDSPPEGLAALLERLGVVLEPLGIG